METDDVLNLPRMRRERYAKLLAGLETRRVKVALYFPLLQRLVEWEPAHGPEP